MKHLAIGIVLVALVGCGGGGGLLIDAASLAVTDRFHRDRSSRPADAPGYIRATTATISKPGQPIYSVGNTLLVGVDHGRAPERLPVTGTREGIDIRQGTLPTGVTRDELADYLRESVPVAERFAAGNPAVRVIGSSTPAQRRLAAAAVRFVNAALPPWAKMEVGAALPGMSLRDTISDIGRRFVSGAELPNTIHIEWVPCSEFYACIGTGATAWKHGGPLIENAYIQMNAGAPAAGDNGQAVILLAHEILHTLGLGHVGGRFDTIMEAGNAVYLPCQTSCQPFSLLYPIDREALRVLYHRAVPGSGITDFGPWASYSRHIVGRSPHAWFGVAFRNGYAEPWAWGDRPTQALADNGALEGRVSWNGSLVGVVPDGSPVTGDAGISVRIETLAGQASFTDIAYDTTGDQWLDGDLRYAIAVDGNTFRQTGGDAGVVTGIFVGSHHQGAAGTVERTDLAAAFGAARSEP